MKKKRLRLDSVSSLLRGTDRSSQKQVICTEQSKDDMQKTKMNGSISVSVWYKFSLERFCTTISSKDVAFGDIVVQVIEALWLNARVDSGTFEKYTRTLNWLLIEDTKKTKKKEGMSWTNW